jgi:hypothetical protein
VADANSTAELFRNCLRSIDISFQRLTPFKGGKS